MIWFPKQINLNFVGTLVANPQVQMCKFSTRIYLFFFNIINV